MLPRSLLALAALFGVVDPAMAVDTPLLTWTDFTRQSRPSPDATIAYGHPAMQKAARPRLAPASPLHSAAPLLTTHVISLGGLPDLAAPVAARDNGCGTEVWRSWSAGPIPMRIFRSRACSRSVCRRHLVNGEDKIILYRMATDYVARAQRAGDQVTRHIVPATGHVELVAPESTAWAEVKRASRAGFAR